MVALSVIAHQHSNMQLTDSWIWPCFCHLWCKSNNYGTNHQFHSIIYCIWQCWDILERLASCLELLGWPMMFNGCKISKHFAFVLYLSQPLSKLCLLLLCSCMQQLCGSSYTTWPTFELYEKWNIHTGYLMNFYVSFHSIQ